MTHQEYQEWSDKILEALKISGEKMLAKKKLLGQKMAILENGQIKVIDAKDYK